MRLLVLTGVFSEKLFYGFMEVMVKEWKKKKAVLAPGGRTDSEMICMMNSEGRQARQTKVSDMKGRSLCESHWTKERNRGVAKKKAGGADWSERE